MSDDEIKGLFSSYPNDFNQTHNIDADGNILYSILAFDQALATALLMIMILAVNDEKNVNIEPGARPFYVGLGLVAIRLG